MFADVFILSHFVRLRRLLSVVVLVVVAMGGAYAQDETKKRSGQAGRGSIDLTNSFRGMLFGSSIEEMEKTIKFEPVSEDHAKGDALKIYIRIDEKKSLGDVAVQEVSYYFFEGKFYAVVIATMDYRQTENLRKALDIVYGGSPHKEKESQNLLWSGKKTTAFMRSDRVTGEGRTIISSNELQKNYDRFSRESAVKAASEL